ncbi:30s ribosomal protein S12 methylthiotransferase accessory protein YcaO [Amphritea opalescens]|uniref:30s ribosomal protein S12 methylthiotransferase accessory protein YcaO n=1 Tax=Amphritea opalescens TaxID=2490544 RepID=A0A430KMZ2_9GAMM|nr:30S ribosomal protein S12 methylthiotransferase accessory factor YcaO [Amphritea opalescens]RTE64733.1 30s ribosomal protein S12 methylthiotransferase accessory protein YcaO [Amphritea opalescens]
MTMILGKDTSLQNATGLMKAKLQTLGFEIDEVEWHNPVPHVWSVRLEDRSSTVFVAQGKGTSQEAAQVSALANLFAGLSNNHFFADYYLGQEVASQPFIYYPNERWFPVTGDILPSGLLDEPTRLHYNLTGELKSSMLLELHAAHRDHAICAIPFERQRNGEQVWIPVNIINNLYGSNGTAAGNCLYEARVQALSEIFQRHIKNTIITSGISLPDIPESVLSRYPSMMEAIETLRGQGLMVMVKDASLGGQFPLVNVTLINPLDGGCCAAFGAHPKFERAFERAVTELLQGRDLDDLSGFSLPSFDLAEVAEQANLDAHRINSTGSVGWDLFSTETDYDYTEWNIPGDAQAEFERLCYLIHKVDMDIYIADYGHLGVHCCRIIVPGMSEVCSVDVLVRDNRNAGTELREPLLNLSSLDDRQIEGLLVALEEGGFDDGQRVVEIIGLLPDEHDIWYSFSVGELKCLLNLRLGELGEALIWSAWLQTTEVGGNRRASLYRCLQQCLMFRLDADRPLEQYHGVLNQIYGADCVTRVLEMIDGHAVFVGFSASTLALEAFAAHQHLLSVYARLQEAKTNR